MRKLAISKNPNVGVLRCILFQNDEGTYVFPCSSVEDGSSIGDYWFETIDEAEEFCLEQYNIETSDWQLIDDPLEFCQHDWIAPVRVKGRPDGKPQRGIFERLEGNEWKIFEP